MIFTSLILPCDNDRSVIFSIQEDTEIGLTDNVDGISILSHSLMFKKNRENI